MAGSSGLGTGVSPNEYGGTGGDGVVRSCPFERPNAYARDS